MLMKLTELEIVDWEPCVLVLSFEPLSQQILPRLKNFVQKWLLARGPRQVCGCDYRYVQFRERPEERKITMCSEWMCPVCVRALANAVEATFPGLQKIELGLHADSARLRHPGFLDISSKKVELEDGG